MRDTVFWVAAILAKSSSGFVSEREYGTGEPGLTSQQAASPLQVLPHWVQMEGGDKAPCILSLAGASK